MSKDSIKYFHYDKGDMERWTGLDKFLSANPEFKIEWEAYKRAIKIAELVLKDAIDRLPDDEV